MKQSKLNFVPRATHRPRPSPSPPPRVNVNLTTPEDEAADDPLPVMPEQSSVNFPRGPTRPSYMSNPKQTYLNFSKVQKCINLTGEDNIRPDRVLETAVSPVPMPSPELNFTEDPQPTTRPSNGLNDTAMGTPTLVSLPDHHTKKDSISSSAGYTTDKTNTVVHMPVSSRPTQLIAEKRKLVSDVPKPQPKRKFNRQWLNEFPWLSYSEETQKAMCKECCQVTKSSVDPKWVTGLAAPFKKESFSWHEKSRAHKENVQVIKAKNAPAETPLAICIKKMDAVMFQHMTHLFNIAYYIAKNEKPMNDFPDLLTLAGKLAVPILKKYGNPHQCREFIHHIATSIKEEVLIQVRQSTFISILVDGSTDRTSTENATVYVRYVYDGCVREDILGLIKLANSTSLGYYESLTNLLDLLALDYKNNFWIIGLGTDGAASMVGHKSGLAIRMGEVCDKIVSIHCVAHRLQLAILDVCKSIPYIPIFDKAVRSVYKFYKGSPKRLHNLQETAAALCDEITKLKDIHAVRWLSSKVDALHALQKNWKSVVTHLEHVASSSSSDEAAKAKGMLRDLKDYKFVKLLHFFLDFYLKLRPLSVAFQLKDIMICDVKSKTEHSLAVLNVLQDSLGEKESVFLDNFKNGELFDIQLNCVVVGERLFQNIRQTVLEKAVQYLQERLSSMSSEVIKAVEIFDSLRWPEKENLIPYGTSQMAFLGKHIYDAHLDSKLDLLQAEWAEYKFMFRDQQFKEALKKIASYKDRFPTLLPVLIFCATLPVSTASCERGFSYQNRIKTDYRTSLKIETMDDLMMIAVNGPSLTDFHPEKSIDRWYFSSQREKYTGTGSANSHTLRQ